MMTFLDYKPVDCIVYIRCLTYNHSAYIKDALNGFAAQNTNFPYACVIVDDCSSDGEQDVIKTWLKEECLQDTVQYYNLELSHLYVVKHKKNTNCTFAFYLLKQNLKGDKRKDLIFEPWRNHTKYESICEGDDYWIYTNKLQEQIDFLENHMSYSATSSNALVLKSATAPMKPFGEYTTKDFYKIQEIVVQRQFHTGTVVFRTSSMQNCPFYRKGRWDTFRWCCLLSQAPIHYDEKATCVYRKQHQGVTESTPTMDWMKKSSHWADVITNCFVPQYVHRKYVVRSVTKGVIRTFFQKYNQLNKEDKKTLKSLYCHNFMLENLIYDFREILRCLNEIIRK